ncbi:MAG: Hdr-like menaquinol oxidoreductase iron-sulfur subunit HmeA [Gammaproteobacteria bacterium]|nr:MAG: Hdr-like menaquinol oxidoreductase iron-sulfur subunit HmeA [Gammaproteobacteria bacterium]
MSLNRREFLGIGAAVTAGAAIAPGIRLIELVQARSLEEAASAQQRWGLLIDTNKCTRNCTACVDACFVENGIGNKGRPATDPQWIRKIETKDPSTGYTHSLPVLCQHCDYPPCVDVCPTGASMKRADGIVLVDKHICIGCRFCMMACPYKARSFVHEVITDQKAYAPRGKGTVESCTLCVHKIDRGDGTTACTEACNKGGHQAIIFGDLKDPNSEISKSLREKGGRQIRADLKLNTGIRYQGL